MNDIVKILPYSIDLNETIGPTELHTLFVVGDNNAHRFEIEIKRGGEAVDLNGATVTGYFTNFKEKTTIEVGGTTEAGRVIVTLKKPCYTLHGQFVLLIQVKIGDVDATIFQGDGFMRASKAEKIVYEDFVIYDVDTLLAQIASMKTATNNANDATAASKAQTEAAKKATDDANKAAEDADGWARATISAQKLAAGSNPTADVQTDEDGHKIITLGIPKGDTGATPQITFEVETGLPGTDVQISVSGTAEEPHVHLTIPRGNTGSLENMPLYNVDPKALGTDADPGTSEDVARGDHVHPMPTASQVGALPSNGTAVNASKLDGKTWAELMLVIYPVGSIYMSVNEVSPATLFGGTWTQLKDRFLLGAGDKYAAGNTGGAAEITLTIEQMPRHRHVLRRPSSNPTTDYESYIATSETDDDVSSSNSDGVRRYTTYEGGSEAHNNMPPYLTVYMWKRVS